ncbi:hypothetical protein GCM10027036_07700 [Flavihumibacter cheonanensis]|uniref:hypothetical protein n=1 Tax=Flavihumibacter cheonanensis TaxID=1442385 RepID=UPI001EF89D22|nr:hypothetical protein [Flavihumibacter cheonanensis]MCG7751788.1 hypothetical protein [Flavihumibacter cheonanensis]
MNISQKQTILTEIETMLSFDFDNMIISQLPENTDFNSIMFGKYPVLEFKALYYKTIHQLKAEVENGLGLLLPNQENFYNDFGSVTLDSDMQNLRAYVSNVNSRNDAAAILERLMYYQVRQGFWDRSAIKLHDVNTDKINAAQQQLQLVQKSLSENLKKFEELKKQFETKQEEVNTFFETKKQEMIEVNRLLAEATSSNTRITELASSATNKDTEIAGVLKNVNDKVTTVTENIGTYQTSFSTIETEAATLKQQLETTISTALQNLDKAKQGVEFVDSKREEIVRLTGMAADGSLGSKFDQRQGTLANGLSFWKWGVPIVTALSILWVIAVFTWLPAHTDNVWINLLVNLLKTTPAFILMGFVFSQYGKERNLQEEYAFKSAVAMTLTAYSSMLEKGDDEGNKTRQEMLLKSIQQVYLQPRIHPEKPERIYAMNGKHLKDAIQTLSEAVKNIKA